MPAATRRQLLAGLGAVGAGWLLSACASTVQDTPKSATSAPPAAPGSAGTPASTTSASKTLTFVGWDYQTDIVRASLDRYQQAHPGTSIDFTAEAQAQFPNKMLALFMANTPLDVVYGRDDNWASWADAGYIQAVDGLPGLDHMLEGMLPFVVDGLKYRGKTWVVPFYADFMSFGYDEQLLNQVGITQPPATWDDLKTAALAIKQARLLDTPLTIALGPTADLHWWTLVYGSGGSLFDADNNPVFANGKDPVAQNLLEWLVQAVNEWKIMDPASITGSTDSSRKTFAAGKIAFATAAKYDFKMLNTPDTSVIAGRARPMLVPTLTAGQSGTCGWQRSYCLASATKDKAASWDFMQYLASPDAEKNWYLNTGVGFVYQALNNDPQIVESTRQWGDVDLFTKQSGVARSRQAVTQPWFAEWSNFNLQQIQNALLAKISPKDALAASASKVDELKKKYASG